MTYAGFSTGGITDITSSASSYYDAFLLTITHRFAKGLSQRGLHVFEDDR